MDCVTTAASHLQSCQSLVAVGLCYGCLWWGHVEAAELRVAGMILRMLRRQAAVLRSGGFPRKILSAFGDQCWLKVSGKRTKLSGLESKMCTKKIVLTCIPPLWWHAREFSVDAFLIALPSNMYRPPYFSPVFLVHLVWRCCRSTESLVKRLLLLLDNMALVLGASKGRGSAPNLNHTCREICVISLATFTIPVCRWIASEDNPADEPSRSKRYRVNMHHDVDQCGPSATGSAPDSELLADLSAEAARVASEEAQTRKHSRVHSCAGVADQSRGWMETGPKSTRRKRVCTNSSPRCSSKSGLPAPPLRRVILPRAEPSHSHGSAPHGHAQRVSGPFFFENVELKLLAKLDEMVVEMLEHLYFQGYGHGT